ncbi:MAG: choice-of-anchor Q domain-containing protein [Rhodanobacteraceae bacterium]
MSPLSAAVVAALVALAPAHAVAAAPHANGTVVVDNCNDNGAGSLRQAIADAPDGGSVDMTALECSVITLSGHLRVNQDDLDILGPGSGALQIDANSIDRVFVHAGLGLLSIDDLAMTNGAYHGGLYFRANGGCVFSKGSLSLDGVTISGCTLTTEFDAPALDVKTGGCVSALNDATLIDTHIRQCTATANDDEFDGGGVYAGDTLAMLGSSITGVRTSSSITLGVGANSPGGFSMKYSTIENNVDVGDPELGYDSQGGGVQTNAPIFLYASTIAQNHAASGGGALFLGEPIDIRNSTIASNTAVERAGVTIINSPDTVIANSTIAFNHSAGSTAGGLGIADSAVEIVSTIIADNTSGAAARDVGASGVSSVSGSHNLIRVSTLAMPPDTLTGDPLLRPLNANGGTTRTLALDAASPAIDAGDNPLQFDNDQRGPGFDRLVGDAVDIGALEYREGDSDPIFRDGFDV